LAQNLSADDYDLIDRITTEKVLLIADDVRARYCRKFQHLHKAQHPPRPPDKKKIVVIRRNGLLRLGSGVCPCQGYSVRGGEGNRGPA
jgi:hypothetical protein